MAAQAVRRLMRKRRRAAAGAAAAAAEPVPGRPWPARKRGDSVGRCRRSGKTPTASRLALLPAGAWSRRRQRSGSAAVPRERRSRGLRGRAVFCRETVGVAELRGTVSPQRSRCLETPSPAKSPCSSDVARCFLAARTLSRVRAIAVRVWRRAAQAGQAGLPPPPEASRRATFFFLGGNHASRLHVASVSPRRGAPRTAGRVRQRRRSKTPRVRAPRRAGRSLVHPAGRRCRITLRRGHNATCYPT